MTRIPPKKMIFFFCQIALYGSSKGAFTLGVKDSIIKLVNAKLVI